MPAWCRPCAKCLRSRRSWGCRGFLPRVFGRRCVWCRWCSGRRRARPPARLGGLTSFGAAPRSPPVPSGPSGALHTGGAALLMCGWVRRIEARPGSAGLAVASNRSGCPCVARPCPAAAHRHRCLAPCLETRPCPPDPPAPFTPVGYSWLMLLGASPRTPARSRSPSGAATRPLPSRRPRIQWSPPTFLSPHPISHAIPPRPFQILKSDRWNCNVFRPR